MIIHPTTDRLHPELWQAEHNRVDWEEDYLDPTYWDYNTENPTFPEPCPDVVAFPFLTEKGGYDMIEELEHYGKWSGGNDAHKDERYKYRKDIHLQNKISIDYLNYPRSFRVQDLKFSRILS